MRSIGIVVLWLSVLWVAGVYGWDYEIDCVAGSEVLTKDGLVQFAADAENLHERYKVLELECLDWWKYHWWHFTLSFVYVFFEYSIGREMPMGVMSEYGVTREYVTALILRHVFVLFELLAIHLDALYYVGFFECIFGSLNRRFLEMDLDEHCEGYLTSAFIGEIKFGEGVGGDDWQGANCLSYWNY